MSDSPINDQLSQQAHAQQIRRDRALRDARPEVAEAAMLDQQIRFAVNQVMGEFKITGDGVSGHGMSWSIKDKRDQ